MPRRRVSAITLLRYGSLVALVMVLLAGYWKPHPLPSLALPAVALVWWWPTIRAGRLERWLFFYVAGIYLYTVLRAFADDLGMTVQSEYAIAIDRVLFLGNVPTVELQKALFTPRQIDFIDFAAVGMHWSFFIVPHAAFAWLWFTRRSLAPRYAAAMLLTLYLGLLLFWLTPTVPPWLAGGRGDLIGTYRVMNFVTGGMNVGAYRELYSTLAGPNAVASVPSIHMALTFLVLLTVRDYAPRWTVPVAIYNVAMGFSLVYLGEHYVFDLLVGMVVAAAVYYLLPGRTVRPVPPSPSDFGLLAPVPVPVER
jgi:membrane-associated phospholipid phosphatase